MKMNIAQWIVCSAACMAVGCSGLERHIRPSEQATVYASPSLQSDAVSQSKTGIDTPLDQNHALRSQPVSQAAYAHQSSQASGVVEPASVDVVMVDPVTSNEAIADGATLEGLLSLAFANNPAIKELAATTQIAAGYRTQVGLYANPMLGYQGQQLADAGTDQHLLFVQQQIITGDKRALNRAVLNEAVRAQVQELEAQKLRVATDIKTAYYDSLRIQEQLASIDQFFGLLKQGVNAAEKRMQAGEGSKIDLLQTQVQLKQLELDRRQLSASLSARLREIVALAGIPNMQLTGGRGRTAEASSESRLESS
jgi:cobalt-zinc-cadmium efflux system outer membrane protein